MKVVAIVVVVLALAVTYYAGSVQGYAKALDRPVVKLHWI